MCLRLVALLIIFAMTCMPSRAGDGRLQSYGLGNGLSSTIIGGAVQDRYGLLWFATWAGLHCYDGYDFHRINIEPGDSAAISSDRILDIVLSARGDILCHTEGDVCEFGLSDFRFRNIPSQSRDSALDVVGKPWNGLTDNQGNLWTADNRSLYKTGTRHHPASLIPGTEACHPRSFLYDGRHLLIGLRSDSSVIVLDSNGSVTERHYLPGAPYVLFRTSSGDIWVGCKPGALMRLGDVKICSDAVYDIREDARGRLWIATFGNGIRCCPDPQAPRPSLSAPFSGGKVRQLVITPSSNIVAATTDGLLVGHIDDNDYTRTSFRRIRRDSTDPDALSSNATMCVARDSRGTLYIATESSGIDVISEESLMGPDPRFRHINTRTSSLKDDVIKAMKLDSDTLLMIVGNDNVTAFNPADGSATNLSRTFWNDTCRFGEATPLRLPDGSWLFGAEEGAFRATSHNIHSRGYVPPLVFTTLAVNGADAKFCLVPRTAVSLDKDSRNITVGFAAIDYVDNTDIRYRSRIDGSPWTPFAPSRSVSLFNMSPGQHVLDVQSTDRFGRLVENTRSLVIDIAPHWYETVWARTIFILLIIAFITGIIYTFFHISDLHRRQRELLARYMALIGDREASAGSTIAAEPRTRPEDNAFLDRVRKYIEDNISNPEANVDAMALAAAASRSTLNRRLRSQLGISAAQLLTRARMKRARELMATAAERNLSMTDIAEMCGYTDVYYFQRVLKKNGDQ